MAFTTIQCSQTVSLASVMFIRVGSPSPYQYSTHTVPTPTLSSTETEKV